MAKKQKKAKAKPKAKNKAKSAAKKAVKKPQAKVQKKIQAVKAPVKASAQKPEKVLAGKKQAFSVKTEEKKKTPKPFVLDEDKDLFDEKMGEDIFEKKGLAGGKDEEAETKKAKEDEEDDDDEWDDDDESEVGEGNKKEDWQTPLPGRFEGEDEDDL